MKYIPNAMKFDTQSRSSLLIVNMILGRFGLKIAICFNFFKIWQLVQIEYANYEYGTWNWWSWPKIIDLGKFWPNMEICSDFYGTWDSQQMEHGNYEYHNDL